MKPILYLLTPLLLILSAINPVLAFDLPFCPTGGPPGWYDRMFGHRQYYAPPPFPPNRYFTPIAPIYPSYSPPLMPRPAPPPPPAQHKNKRVIPNVNHR